jgi:hypothetical protein
MFAKDLHKNVLFVPEILCEKILQYLVDHDHVGEIIPELVGVIAKDLIHQLLESCQKDSTADIGCEIPPQKSVSLGQFGHIITQYV